MAAPVFVVMWILYKYTQRVLQTLHFTTKYVYKKSTTVYVPSSQLGLSQQISRQRV
jgi:hypothetical protein